MEKQLNERSNVKKEPLILTLFKQLNSVINDYLHFYNEFRRYAVLLKESENADLKKNEAFRQNHSDETAFDTLLKYALCS